MNTNNSHKMLIPFIVKVSVLGYFSLPINNDLNIFYNGMGKITFTITICVSIMLIEPGRILPG